MRCLRGRLQREEAKLREITTRTGKTPFFPQQDLNFRYHPMDTHFGLSNNQIPHIKLQYLINCV